MATEALKALATAAAMAAKSAEQAAAVSPPDPAVLDAERAALRAAVAQLVPFGVSAPARPGAELDPGEQAATDAALAGDAAARVAAAELLLARTAAPAGDPPHR